jgi:two-component system chemotaxis response regulator CheY
MHRVLVIDDSMLIRHTVCCFLEEMGFEVESADDGVAALRLLAVQLPDLIVTDMQMPRMGGRELIARLKQHPDTASIPVVVLTGDKSGQMAEPVSDAEFVIYKDIDIEEQLRIAISMVAFSGAAD